MPIGQLSTAACGRTSTPPASSRRRAPPARWRDERDLGRIAPGAAAPAPAFADTPALPPLDPQNPGWSDDTTWNDYKPLPGRDYSDPSIQPTVKKWRVALVMTDFPDREYAITRGRDGGYAPLPATLTSWSGPVSNDLVPVGFKQQVRLDDPCGPAPMRRR